METTQSVVRRSSVAAGMVVVLVAFALFGPHINATSALELTRAVNLTSPDADVGPPFQVADPESGVPQTPVSQPAVAFGGSVHLSAWSDGRGGIWAARTTPSGEVLDPVGFPVNDGGVGTEPEVAFDGTNFLVIWADGQSVEARRVSPDGLVLDPEDLTLTDATDGMSPPSVVFDGSNYLVVWTRWAAGSTTASDVAGRRVAPSGAMVDPAELTLSSTPTHQLHPRIAFNGRHHLVVWQTDLFGDADIAGALVAPDGTAAGPAAIPVSVAASLQQRPTVTAVGDSFLVAWNDERAGAGTDIFGTPVDATGTVGAPDGIAIASGTRSEASPLAVSDGTDALVMWGGQQNGLARRLDSAGQPLDPSPITLLEAPNELSAAFDGTNYFVTGAIYRLAPPTVDSTLHAMRVTPGGAVLDPNPVTIATAANAQQQLDMASGGDDRLVVWIDDRPAAPGLYGARVGPDGEILDGTGFPIALGGSVNQPAVAFDGVRFLVVWDDDTGIFGAFVTTAGQVSEPITVNTPTPGVASVGSPAVAFGGGTFLVAWTHSEMSPQLVTLGQVRAGRVSSDGVVADPAGARLTLDHQMATEAPSVAFGDSDFLVVWQQIRDWHDSIDDIHGVRVTTGGSVVELGAFPVSETSEDERRPDVAWNGDRYLVVWETAPAVGDSEPTDVRGARVGGDGVVEDPSSLVIADGPEHQRAPSVAANGPFLVTWTQRRDNLDTDVLATEVEGNGYIGHPDGFVVAEGPTPELDPVATAVPGDRNFAVVFQRLVIDAPYGTDRALTSQVHVSPK